MSSTLARLNKVNLLKIGNGFHCSKVNLSAQAIRDLPKRHKMLLTGGLVGTGLVGLAFALNESVKASELILHPPHHPWHHNGLFKGLDMASVRRGYEVYKQVCSACHSLRFVAYRELVGATHTEEEAKAEAAQVEIQDGPDDTGKMFMRPGKLSDYFPSPYPNEEAARAANNGAYPPDLTYITLGRHGGEDYVFSLLTGYCDPPAGVTVQEGQYFNPYFPGGAIGMAQALYNEVVEYEDGTPPTASQLAKDVANFLKWAGEPEYEERQKFALRVLFYGTVFTLFTWYMKRHVWAAVKARKILFRQKNK